MVRSCSSGGSVAFAGLRWDLRRRLDVHRRHADIALGTLDPHHQKEAKKNLEEANRRLEGSIREAYRLLLVPMQDPDAPDGLTTVHWEDDVLSLSGGAGFDKEIERVTRAHDWVIQAWAPPHLRDLMVRWFWKEDRPAAPAQKVWLNTCSYLYLPRLQKQDVFVRTISDGVLHEDFFGYAAGEKAGGGYEGLVFGSSGGVYLSDSALLVRSDVAAAARAAATPQTRAGAGGRSTSSNPPDRTGATGSRPPSSRAPARLAALAAGADKKARRFHATVTLDPHDPIGSFASVVENVVEHFTSQYGTEVTLTLDVEAKRGEGFEPKTVRVVRENAATLKFKTAEFEDD